MVISGGDGKIIYFNFPDDDFTLNINIGTFTLRISSWSEAKNMINKIPKITLIILIMSQLKLYFVK